MRSIVIQTYAETYTDADVTGIAYHTITHTWPWNSQERLGRARQDLAGFELGYLASVDDVCCNPRV